MFWMYWAAFTSPFIARFRMFVAIASCFVIGEPSGFVIIVPSQLREQILLHCLLFRFFCHIFKF